MKEIVIFLLIFFGLIFGGLFWATGEYEKEKFQFAQDYNKLALERHLPILTPAEYASLTHDDIKNLYVKLKYGVDLPQKQMYPVYIYSGS